MQVAHNSKVHVCYTSTVSVLGNVARFFVTNIAIIRVRCTTPLECFVSACVCVHACVCRFSEGLRKYTMPHICRPTGKRRN